MLKILLLAILCTHFYDLVNADNIDRDAEILNYRNENADAEGNYAYEFETSNGIQQQEIGREQSVSGSYEFITPEGLKIQLQYVADENGYKAIGEHLPTPPPIPEAILKSLEYIAAHPPEKIIHKN